MCFLILLNFKRGPLQLFEAETNRSINKDAKGATGVLAWVLARQNDQMKTPVASTHTSFTKPDDLVNTF